MTTIAGASCTTATTPASPTPPRSKAKTRIASHVACSAKAKPAKPKAGTRQQQLGELAERLGDKLDTRVKIALGSSKGTITIDFATVADLRRILTELGVDPDVG